VIDEGALCPGRSAEGVLKGIEVDEEDGVSSDVTGKWKKTAMDLTDNILAELKGMGRDVGSEEEDALGPSGRQWAG
jgi:hypothetical protein